MDEWDGTVEFTGQSIAQLITEFVWVGVKRGNKFAVGDLVLFKGSQYKIMGTSGEDEYTLENWAFLVWEDELEEVTMT